MKAKTNTITINGRTYDAATGKPLHGQTVFAPQKAKVHQTTNTVHHAKVSTIAKPAPAQRPASTTKKINITHVAGSERVTTHRGTGVAARPIDKSHTLMRHVVKKPGTARTTRKAVASPLSDTPKIVMHKGRVNHAPVPTKIYTKSSQISRFGQRQTVTKRTATIPVQPAPTHSHGHHSAVKPMAHYDIANTPPATQAYQPRQGSKTLRETHRDLFESAMVTATSHQTPKVHAKRKHRKAARLALSAASLALLIGFFTYQNMPSLALKRASSTIGFTAAMPGYRPSGFHMANNVHYAPGKVTIDFRSNSDNRSYRITQVAADMSDDTLRNKLLQDQTYEQLRTNGQTAYFYGADNLTWVRNGIWYTIDGDSQLSKDQLLRVAGSLL